MKNSSLITVYWSSLYECYFCDFIYNHKYSSFANRQKFAYIRTIKNILDELLGSDLYNTFDRGDNTHFQEIIPNHSLYYREAEKSLKNRSRSFVYKHMQFSKRIFAIFVSIK